MKKIAALTLICALLMLTGCSNETPPAAQQADANFQPETTAIPNATSLISSTAEPTLSPVIDEPLQAPIDATATPNAAMLAGMEDEPEATPEAAPRETESVPEVPPTPESPYLGYNYAQLDDDAFGFTLNYPTAWINLPGKYTACFQEQTLDGSFPARVAVTSKRLAHKPDDDAVVKQFQAFAKQIYAGYDPKTFEFGELQSKVPFMGKNGHSITYLAYSGDTEIKGYMCCCAIDYTVYVFHFTASYDDYESMTPVMTRIRDSVALAK